MTLTRQQQQYLDTMGLAPLMGLRASGELPDCPAVNARIAQRAYQENPANWSRGRWFLAQYQNSRNRRGPVWVRRDDTPFGVTFRIVHASGSWCDSFDTHTAKKHLVAVRDNAGNVAYLNPQQQLLATQLHNHAMSR